jgi:rare lipoprotein A
MKLITDAAPRGAAPRRVLLAAGLLALAATPAFAGSAKVQGQGIASFYGGEHHGGPTASGERFNMHAMTAAHRTAPLGTHLKVTNLRNGKSVVVRINDRGPFIKGRIIDLSRGAADVLGFTGAGLTRVAIETAETGAKPGPVAGSLKVASLEPETTGTSATSETPSAEAAKPVLSEAERAMIDRTASSDR